MTAFVVIAATCLLGALWLLMLDAVLEEQGRVTQTLGEHFAAVAVSLTGSMNALGEAIKQAAAAMKPLVDVLRKLRDDLDRQAVEQEQRAS